MLQIDSSGIYRSSLLSEIEWLEHGFGTRNSLWPEPARLASAKQIHSAHVIEVDTPGVNGEADALITNEPGLVVGVKTADCVPVLLVDRKNRAVAAVHAGWRGTAQAILLRAIQLLHSRFHTDPVDLIAAIGPCIQRCCYEVGSDVLQSFQAWLPEQDLSQRAPLDLVEVNLRQLRSAGVPLIHTDHGAPCTYCSPDKLHSFRRDGIQAGRMMSAIGIRPLQ